MSRAPWHWPGSRIIRVLDGDTVEVLVTRATSIDIGFGGTADVTHTFTVRLRLNRINTAKGSSEKGKAATAYLREMLPVGAVVYLETLNPYKFGGPDDSPGEWMVEITLPGGANVSDAMVAGGHAVYWDGEGIRPADQMPLVRRFGELP